VSEYVCLVDSSEMFFSYTVISELEASLPSPNKAVSTDKSVKDDSKFIGQLSRIKVQNMTDKKKVWRQAYVNSVQYMYMYRYCVAFTLCICSIALKNILGLLRTACYILNFYPECHLLSVSVLIQ